MLSVSESQVWDALEIGPQWILRETEDVTLAETALLRREPTPAQNSAPVRPSMTTGSLAARSSIPTVATPSAPFEGVPSVRASAKPAHSRPTTPIQPVTPVTPQTAKLEMDPALAQAIPNADWGTLEALAKTCSCCSMSKSRQHVVFAEGGPGVRIALVGEAPGSEEDLQGIPFVGKSGQLLTQMLESVGVERNRDIAIMNVLKCRPPGNRNPAPAEVNCCAAFLRRQLALVRPDVILIMGRFAVQSLLQVGPEVTIGSCRGRVHEVTVGDLTAKAIVTYHPSYLLRSPDAKAKAWEDLVLFKHAVADAGITLEKLTH